ncbi:3-dehydroquinate dehydratase [uncultured archaeon]|nr:3-dehydroquinate dehydratase [uncultured archaeon]
MNMEGRMEFKPRIVAVLGKNALRDVPRALEADMMEVRLDRVEGDPLEVMRSIRGATSLPLIATNRCRAEGGLFKGTERERIDLLCQASEYADFVDIELRADLKNKLLERIDKPAIVSYHDFARMPGLEELRSILREISETRASIAKIAVTPRRLKDNLTLLELLLKANTPLCVIPMGKLGQHVRAIASIYGSVLTYGYISEATAPGQTSISELKQLQTLLGLPSGIL